jgi:hypothetical protein
VPTTHPSGSARNKTTDVPIHAAVCHAKLVARTNRVISPGIYNVINGFTVIWLFGQFRWPSCNKLALFSDCKSEYYHHLGALLEPSLPSRVEREETLNTPLWLILAIHA